jgi:AraC family transcriptional regulator, transcriptional activator of pobA
MVKSVQYLDISNMASTASTIQSYSLFGESKHLPDVMHCETIAARSVLHGWELAPHRHARLHQVLLLQEGSGTASLDGNTYALSPGSMVNVPAGHVHAFRFATDTQGWVATLPEELLGELLTHVGELRSELGLLCVVKAPAPVRTLMQQIWQEYSGRSRARALMLRGLSATLLSWVARTVAEQNPEVGQSTEPNIVQAFRKLIQAHYLEHWRVSDYARALAVSPTHLSRLTREATGSSALRLIEARTMREARRQLAYTHLNIATVAYAMGYSDPAHFSRVFTRDAGVSPRAFRARVS